MKKHIYIFFILIVLSVSMHGQTEFNEFLNSYSQQITNCINDKDYNCAVVKFQEIIKKYDSLSDNEKKKHKQILENIYYSLACCQALSGKPDEALIAFEKAITNGYINYSHAKSDSDLNSIRELPKFRELMESIREKGDYTYILQKSGPYTKEPPVFSYQSSNDPELVKLKKYFNLDSIAGNGGEISKILNLLIWSHNLIRHDGNYMPNVDKRTAISFYEYVKKYNKGMNCRAMAIFLNECYLAMGFKSYYITCLPKNSSDLDCHVINSVYSTNLKKWVWIDPTFNAWVMDENKNMLSIQEVRQRIIDQKPLFINDEANWNNRTKQTKEMYIDGYMAKNLYWFSRPTVSMVNADMEREFNCTTALVPLNHYLKNIDSLTYYSHDEEYFWGE